MKKLIVAFICMAILVSACGSSGSSSSSDSSSQISSSQSTTVSASSSTDSTADSMTDQLAKLVMDKIKPDGEMIKLTSDTVKNFYTLPDDTKYSIYVSAVWTADELAIFEVANDSTQIVDAVKSRLSSLKKSLEGYKDDVFAVVSKNATIYTADNYVVFISGSAENVSAAKSAFEEASGKKLKEVSTT